MKQSWTYKMLFASLFGIFMMFMPAISYAQKGKGNLKAPAQPTPIEVRERTIGDLLYFPFSCIEAPMATGLSNRKKPISVFKWVSVDAPGKVKVPSPSNIETAAHVGKYKVELGVMRF